MSAAGSRLRIIVGGMAGLFNVGGIAWDYFQYVVGLARLGHDVYYHEDTWSWPYHPIERAHVGEGDYSAQFIDGFFRRYAPDLRDRWHYRHLQETSFGMSEDRFREVARSADLFLNVSGATLLPDELPDRCTSVFLDTDPGYNQILLVERPAWSENIEHWCESVRTHDRFFTYAENIGAPDCLVPDAGLDWQVTRIPIVAGLWRTATSSVPPPDAPWTTVMTWSAFKGPLVLDGVEYGSKGREFERIIELPGRTPARLSILVGGIDAPLERLATYGWEAIDAPSATLTPDAYQAHIMGSRGEVSTAKHVYVAMRTGWFSTRSACYLAAGRPVVVQDTGFSKFIPTGEGLLAFSTLDEAADAIARVERDYARHAAAATRVASEHFAAERVLCDLLALVESGHA